VFNESLINYIAKETGFVKRTSQVNAINFLDLILSNCLKGDLMSLESLARYLKVSTGISISKQGLDERFNSGAVLFLKTILTRMMAQHYSACLNVEDGNSFVACRVRDSTRFRLPDEYASVYKGHGGATNTKSMISIQYEFDLMTGEPIDLQLTSGCRNDQQDTKESVLNVKEGELLIRDLGYVTTTYMLDVAGRGAFFLNRLPTQINVYDMDNKLIDFKKLHRKLKRYNLEYQELDVLLGKKAQIPCRLVVSVCELEASARRMKKTAKNTKSTGHKVSEETKIRSRLHLYITNAPKDKIQASNIYHIYSMRWQIELIFKAWKSIAKIDKVKKMKIERFESVLLSGLIWLMANWRIFQVVNKWTSENKDQNKTLSTWKFYSFMADNQNKIWDIIKGKEQMKDWLEIVLELLEKNLFRETKNGDVSHLQKLNLLKVA